MRRILFLALWSLASGPSATAAEALPLAPQAGVLLLNNGELIEGMITCAGDRYDVELKDSQIHVKRCEVAIFCRNAHECYLHKREDIEEGRAQDHLDLAEWCLRNSLVADAERELSNARAVDPSHPKIRLLGPRLELAKQSPQVPEPLVAPSKNAAVEQLDSLVRNLPPGSMESFTNSIQPLLLNYCTRSGCHGPRSTGALRLERIAPNRLAGRHPTQRNLQATLALIDRNKPEESKLLQAPIRPHGNLKAPVFTDREQSQYKQLLQWVYSVAGAQESSARPTLDERATPLLQAIGRRDQPANDPASAPLGEREPTPADSQDQTLAPAQRGGAADGQDLGQAFRVTRAHGQLVLRPLTRQGETPGDSKPKDPFDPEIFNRRFFGK